MIVCRCEEGYHTELNQREQSFVVNVFLCIDCDNPTPLIATVIEYIN